MTNPKLEKFKQLLIRAITDEYGCCGVADSGDSVMINFGGEDESFVLTLKDESSIDIGLIEAKAKLDALNAEK